MIIESTTRPRSVLAPFAAGAMFCGRTITRTLSPLDIGACAVAVTRVAPSPSVTSTFDPFGAETLPRKRFDSPMKSATKSVFGRK